MTPAKTDGVGNHLSIDAHRNHRRIGQTHLDVLVAGLGSDTLFSDLEQFLLRARDCGIQFLLSNGFGRLRPLFRNRGRAALDKFARDADNRHGCNDAARRFFGAQQGFIAIGNHARNIGHYAIRHVAITLGVASRPQNNPNIVLHFDDDGLCIGCANIECCIDRAFFIPTRRLLLSKCAFLTIMVPVLFFSSQY